jgi:opacity protein-like surface antigen
MKNRTRALVLALMVSLYGQSSAIAQGFFGGLKVATPTVDGSAEAAAPTFFPRTTRTPDALGVGLRVPAWERTRNLFSTEQTTVYGGLKTEFGLGVGAAFSQLRPAQGSIPGTLTVQSNPLPLGLLSSTLGQPLNPGNVGLDVYSSFDVSSKISLFGRLGYERNELRPLQQFEANLISPIAGTTIRSGQSLNYGIGVRMDVTPSLGVRAEFSRGLRVDHPDFSKETESDTLSLGLRWKF